MMTSVYSRWKGSTRKSRRMRLTGLVTLALSGLVAFMVLAPRTSVDRFEPATPTGPAPGSESPASVAALSPPPPASTPPPASARAEKAPAIGFPENGFVLVACKRDRTLYVYKREANLWKRTAAFPMAIGRRTGDKGEAGDLRTPEGRFWITSMLSGRLKGPAYGPLVLTLNYPRPGDVAEGKSGQGIWIHGVEAGKLPSFTKGCLALANEDMLALSSFADIATPVVILADSLAPDPARQVDLTGMESEYPSIVSAYARKNRADTAARELVLKQAREFVAKETKDFPELAMQALSEGDRKAILARLERWRADWTGRALDTYAANYDPAFRDRQGRDKQAFLERKRKIFSSKSKIEMEIREPKIESESYSRVKVSFRQDYLAEDPQGVQRSSEPKSLRLEEGPGGWLIITE